MRGSIECAVIGLVLVIGGCAGMGRGNRGEIQHVVIIWLKQPADVEARHKLIERSYEFRKIPGVKSVAAGSVVPSDRKNVDSTFDIGVVITFEDEEALRAYDQNPIHQQAVKEVLMPLAARVVIYDIWRE